MEAGELRLEQQLHRADLPVTVHGHDHVEGFRGSAELLMVHYRYLLSLSL